MAGIVEVKKRRGPEGRASLDAGFEASEIYYVAVDSPDFDAKRLVSASKGGVSIPEFFEPHPDMPGTIVVSKTATKIDDSGLYFDVHVEYASRNADISGLFPNPINRPPKISWGQEIGQEYRELDIFGASFKDVHGFDIDAMPVDDIRPVLTVVRNQTSFSPLIANAFTGAVNNDLFFGQKRQARVKGITANFVYGSGQNYWEVNYVVVFRRHGWRWPIKHRSFYEASAFGVVRVKAEDGTDVPEPVAIDDRGFRVPAGAPDWWMTKGQGGQNIPVLAPGEGEDAAWRIFGLIRYPELPFADMGIGVGG